MKKMKSSNFTVRKCDKMETFNYLITSKILGQGQLTVKGSSNRILPRFKEPILG